MKGLPSLKNYELESPMELRTFPLPSQHSRGQILGISLIAVMEIPNQSKIGKVFTLSQGLKR